MRFASATVVGALVVSGTVAGAQPVSPPTETGETTAVSYDESTTEFGRLHLAAQVLGYQFSKPTGGLVAAASAVFELHPRLFLNARVAVPIPGLNDRDAAPFRLEGGIQIIAMNKLEVEYDHVTLKQERTGNLINETFVKVPHLNRKRGGLEASILVARGGAKFDNAGVTIETTTSALIGAVGVNAMDTHGYVTSLENVGKLKSFLWTNGGLDLLVDLTRSYEIEPDDKGRRFGGRIWGETLFRRHLGIATRIELGKYPGQAGWIFLVGVGGALHL